MYGIVPVHAVVLLIYKNGSTRVDERSLTERSDQLQCLRRLNSPASTVALEGVLMERLCLLFLELFVLDMNFRFISKVTKHHLFTFIVLCLVCYLFLSIVILYFYM